MGSVVRDPSQSLFCLERGAQWDMGHTLVMRTGGSTGLGEPGMPSFGKRALFLFCTMVFLSPRCLEESKTKAGTDSHVLAAVTEVDGNKGWN